MNGVPRTDTGFVPVCYTDRRSFLQKKSALQSPLSTFPPLSVQRTPHRQPGLPDTCVSIIVVFTFLVPALPHIIRPESLSACGFHHRALVDQLLSVRPFQLRRVLNCAV